MLLCHAEQFDRLGSASDLTLVYVVPRANSAVREEARVLGLQLAEVASGYHRVRGGTHPGVLVETRRVARAEGDDLLSWFGGVDTEDRDARQWVLAHTFFETEIQMSELEGYDEAIEKFLALLPAQRRLAGLPAEDRLAGLDPSERLAGLDPSERLAGLDPSERLAGLDPSEVMNGLPDQVLEAITKARATAAMAKQFSAFPVEVLAALPDAVVDELPDGVRAVVEARLKSR